MEQLFTGIFILLFQVLSYNMATKRKRNVLVWAFLTLAFALIALPVLFFLPKLKGTQYPDGYTVKGE